MSSSASPSSDHAKGKNFLEKLQYVQHVDQEKKMTSELSELILLKDLLADRKVDGHDSNSTENVGNSEANLDILKSSLKEKIIRVCVCSNPLPIPIGSSKRVTFHAFVVFLTHSEITNSKNEEYTYWSLEKNGNYIVLQQSTNRDDVAKKLYDAEKGQSVERYGEVKFQKWNMGNSRPLEDLLQVIWETNQISDPYHFLYSNCQNFASFIFEILNGEGEKWSTGLSATVDLLRVKNKKTAIELNALMYQEMDLKYQSIVNDDKFYCYWAMMNGRRKDFEELTNDLTIEFLNSVDSQGYTLLEWATVFSTSHWPIDEELKKKGAQIPSDEEGLNIFHRNVFFIALQYQKKKSKLPSFDGIDIHGVANKAGETALHLALYGEKWQIAEEILRKFKNDDVNKTNSQGETPLHLAAKLNCELGLFKKILSRTHSKNINKTDGNGWTALHYAIDGEFETKVKELVNHKDVNVNIKNHEDNSTALHLASKWPNIPADLFKKFLEKSTSDTIDTRDVHGSTALHLAIFHKSKTVVKELLNYKNVNVANNENGLALHLASRKKDFPMDLFKQILEKTADVNAQDIHGHTALHYAIIYKSKTNVKKLLEDNRVDVNVKNNKNRTALHFVCWWKDIPMDLFKIILERTVDINAKDEYGDTALHSAIPILYHSKESGTKVKKLLEDRVAGRRRRRSCRVDVKVKNNNETALHLASRWKGIPADLFKIILEKLKDVINTKDGNGNTALHLAIENESEIATKELLAHSDVDVKVKNNYNETALSYASEWKDIPSDLFKIILEKSTDINAQDKYGYTALHNAILFKSEIATKELLPYSDVDVNVEDAPRETPLHWACLWWKDIPSDLFKLILEKSKDVNAHDQYGHTALHNAISGKSEIATKKLLGHNDVNVNVKDNNNVTSLHFASSWKDIPMDLFKKILKKSTDINAQDENGWTALHFAMIKKSKIATKALLAHKDVDVNVRNNEENAALHFASSYWKDIPIDLFKTIQNKSTDINAQDKDGKTALHYAFCRNDQKRTRVLLKDDRVNVNVKDNHNLTALDYAIY